MSMPTTCAAPTAAFTRAAWSHPAFADAHAVKANKAYGARRSGEHST